MGVGSVEREWADLKQNARPQRRQEGTLLETWTSLTQIRKELRDQRYEEQQLGLDIWTWTRDQLIALSVDLAYRVGIHRTLDIP